MRRHRPCDSCNSTNARLYTMRSWLTASGSKPACMAEASNADCRCLHRFCHSPSPATTWKPKQHTSAGLHIHLKSSSTASFASSSSYNQLRQYAGKKVCATRLSAWMVARSAVTERARPGYCTYRRQHAFTACVMCVCVRAHVGRGATYLPASITLMLRSSHAPSHYSLAQECYNALFVQRDCN